MNEETTTKLSDSFEELYAGTLVLQTNMTLGIDEEIVARFLAYSKLCTYLLDETTPEYWSERECEGIACIVEDMRNIGMEIRDWCLEQTNEAEEEMDGG